MEKRYRLELIGITYNQLESGVRALVLQQAGGTRRIPIIIGFPEAQAIECKLQEIKTPRPLTHDMMITTLDAFGLKLKEVEIKKLPNGVFSADLHVVSDTEEKIIDSRSSDAIALAIRVGAPIYTSEQVLLESGFEPSQSKNTGSAPLPDSDSKKSLGSQSNKKSLKNMSLQQLNEAMMKAAENEDYEEAARIKAEIDERMENSEKDKE